MAFVLHGDGAILLMCWQVMLWSGSHILIICARFDGENPLPVPTVVVNLVAADHLATGVGLDPIKAMEMTTSKNPLPVPTVVVSLNAADRLATAVGLDPTKVE